MSTAIERADGRVITPVADTEPGNVSSLVALAIEKGVDVAVLERLVALQERVTERNARAAFFEALSSFQDECPEIRKSKTASIATNSGGSYSYNFAPLEQITRTIRPVLKKHGLSYSWNTEYAGDGILNVICILRHIEGHEERAAFPVPTGTSAKMSDAQKNGAALTYGRRQSLIAVLGLTTADEDSDAMDRQQKDPEKITRSEAADLECLADEVGINKARFLTWLATEANVPLSSFEDIPKGLAPHAKRAIEAKRKS